MKTPNKLSNFREWMNKKLGYREDYEKMNLYQFLLEHFRRYILYYYHYHNNYAKTEYKEVKKYTTATMSGKQSYVGKSMEFITIPAPGRKAMKHSS